MILSTFSVLNSWAQEKNNQWTFTRGLNSEIRGGTSEGTLLDIDKSASIHWKNLQDKNLNKFQKDRLAILALQGEFKATFEFMETILLDTSKKFDTPYASWGTEFVKVIEDNETHISLQHILVMFMKDKASGKNIGPHVIKHWRQDWQWTPDELLVFQGENHWKKENISPDQSTGKWKWSIYQVDDTPRYSAIGSWTHLNSASTFDTQLFSRPLPRREFSVRSDYKVLLAKDSLVLTSNAWFHEQKNFKHQNKLSEESNFSESSLLSREIGHNSYLRIKDFDFSAGQKYWKKTSPYWKDVRSLWERIMSSRDDLKLKSSYKGKKLFEYHFENAENEKILKMSSKKRTRLIMSLLKNFIK
jgi:hypothetical protein